MRPLPLVTRRHHVGMAGKDQVRRAAADGGEQVFDVRCARRGELQPFDGETRLAQDAGHPRLRAALGRRYRRAGDQRLQQGDRFERLGHGPACGKRRRVRLRFNEAFGWPSTFAANSGRSVAAPRRGSARHCRRWQQGLPAIQGRQRESSAPARRRPTGRCRGTVWRPARTGRRSRGKAETMIARPSARSRSP